MGEITVRAELENVVLADCTNHRLIPRPESPDYPLLKLK
jgi:hypothetical protein